MMRSDAHNAARSDADSASRRTMETGCVGCLGRARGRHPTLSALRTLAHVSRMRTAVGEGGARMHSDAAAKLKSTSKGGAGKKGI